MHQQTAEKGATVHGAHPPPNHHRPVSHLMHHDQAAAAMALADMERGQDADRRELESRRALAYWW